MKVLKRLIKKFKHKIKIALGYTYKGNRNKEIIFILSTGRCGSTSIKDILNQHPKFLAFHEEIRPLISLSTNLAEHPENKKEIYKQIDRVFENRIWEAKKGQIIIHSDHRLWNLAPYLSNYFPNAYFIHLIRNPYDSVKSFIQRDWYLDTTQYKKHTIFDQYRLHGDKVKNVKEQEWNSYSQVDKCLWYWNYVNTNINRDIQALSQSKSSYIKLEQFETSLAAALISKFKFIEDFKFYTVQKNQSKKELQSNETEDVIKKKIKAQSDILFLDYYPEFK